MAVTERRGTRLAAPRTERGATPPPVWSWDRSLPITEPAARPGRGLRVFPGVTWWAAAVITMMFVALVIVV